jgi:hypothetical protein
MDMPQKYSIGTRAYCAVVALILFSSPVGAKLISPGSANSNTSDRENVMDLSRVCDGAFNNPGSSMSVMMNNAVKMSGSKFWFTFDRNSTGEEGSDNGFTDVNIGFAALVKDRHSLYILANFGYIGHENKLKITKNNSFIAFNNGASDKYTSSRTNKAFGIGINPNFLLGPDDNEIDRYSLSFFLAINRLMVDESWSLERTEGWGTWGVWNDKPTKIDGKKEQPSRSWLIGSGISARARLIWNLNLLAAINYISKFDDSSSSTNKPYNLDARLGLNYEFMAKENSIVKPSIYLSRVHSNLGSNYDLMVVRNIDLDFLSIGLERIYGRSGNRKTSYIAAIFYNRVIGGKYSSGLENLDVGGDGKMKTVYYDIDGKIYRPSAEKILGETRVKGVDNLELRFGLEFREESHRTNITMKYVFGGGETTHGLSDEFGKSFFSSFFGGEYTFVISCSF